MATRKTYALDQCPLYNMASRKRLAKDVFNVDLPFLERLAANPLTRPILDQPGLKELVEIRKALGKDGERVQAVFVTVDPDRDSADVLKAYLGNFDPSFIALRPNSPEQLAALAKDYKVYYKKVEGRTATSYTMDHSAGSYVYDTHGQLRLYTRYGMGVKPLTEDIRQLLKQAS